MVLVLIGIGLPPLIHSTVNAARHENSAGPLEKLFPPEIGELTDGGTVIYNGGFYEVVKRHEMAEEEGQYYEGIQFSIAGIALYDDVELK